MKVKIFQSRKLVRLEQEVNVFLNENDVSIQHTQFSTVYAQDEVAHLMFHTLILFYYPRVEEPDPFEEEQEPPDLVQEMHDRIDSPGYNERGEDDV